ncbi:MAG: hypothetical protein ACE5LS_04465 [Thermoplasmata archaeon]
MAGYDKVLGHLLFHQALEEEEPEKMARYVQLLERVQEGRLLPTPNRYEESVVTAFELVLDDSFDPWDIDLARFSREYMKRLRRLGTVNFVAAGRLVLLAWSVLKLQSETILSTAETANPPAEEMMDDTWDVMPGFYGAPEEVDLTHQILQGEEAPLKEGFHREIQRPVGLVDLLEALDQAFRETSGAVARPSTPPPAPVEGLRDKLHREDLAEDLQWAWDLIQAAGGEVVAMGQLSHQDAWDRATLFLSVLFLAEMGWLEVWQKNLPGGEIYLRPLRDDGEVAVTAISPLGAA